MNPAKLMIDNRSPDKIAPLIKKVLFFELEAF
jgi:hypothetical protein